MKALRAARRLLRLAAASLVACACLQAAAAEPAWPDVRVTMQAQDRPLRDFLQDFFGSIGMRAAISEGVTGRLSGRFNDKPAALFAQLVRANNLLPYYDGAVMHVASAAEITGKTIAVAPGEGRTVVAGLGKLAAGDPYQSVQLVGDGRLIKVRGSREFVQDVEDLVESRRRGSADAEASRESARMATARPPTAAAPAAWAPAPFSGGPQVVRSFPLKYASAADIVLYQNGQPVNVPGMATMLNVMLGDGAPGATSLAAPRRINTNLDKLRGQGLRRYGAESVYGAEADAALPVARVDAAEGRRGPMRIAADRSLNAVIVRDAAAAMPMYERLIADLDKPPQLIEIQVAIVDIDQNRLSDLGFDWRYRDDRTSLRLGGGLPLVPDLGGLLFNTVIGDAHRFFARINALASEGAARVTSRPQVLTISNMEAVLTNDQSFYVRVAGDHDVDLFNVSAGTSLRVVPFVAGDSANPQIRLTVTIEDGSVSNENSVDGIPVVDRNSLNTQAVIFSGENLLLGGLVREKKRSNTDKVPLLGDIPAVGKLFQHTTKTESRTERLYLITPRIVTGRPGAPAAPTTDPTGARREPRFERPFQDVQPARIAEHAGG